MPRYTSNWTLTLPAGFRYEVSLRELEPDCYALEKAVRFSGGYERRGSRLVMVRPADRDEGGFEWEIDEDCLILVRQRPVAKLGSDYRGATLKNPNRTGSPGQGDKPKPQADNDDGIKAEVRGTLRFESGCGYFIAVNPLSDREYETQVWLWISEDKVLVRKLQRLNGKSVIAKGKLAQLSKGHRTSVPPLGMYVSRFEIKEADAR